ncbi:MAG: tetratricopeptide repeat protein [Treponema sp.]|jgi:tetratricopeptide (TPR) repeat protein|nr:tetratricopeptide repeat protein [Treponema sp.]
MKLDPILTKATRLARSGNYQGAVRTLVPEINRYNGSFRYFYLLAVSCLHVGDFGGALTYFKVARDIKIRHPGVLLGFAVLYLRRGEIDKAVDFYLEVQELDEKNRIAKKALKIIRTYAGAGNFSAWLDSGDLPKLYPPVPPAGLSWNRVLVSAAAVFVVLAFTAGLLFYFRVIPNPFMIHRGDRRGITEISLEREDREQPVETGGSYSYILTRNEVLKTYERALTLFTEYRDEAAKTHLNRILESNASPGVKNKSRLLLSYMEPPGFETFSRKDNFSYAEVMKEPALYRDCHVIWRGMATNMDFFQNLTAFDFLVGYDTRKVWEGTVPVIFDKTISLSTEKPLEVLGRIVLVSTEKGPDIRLEGVAIYQPAGGFGVLPENP